MERKKHRITKSELEKTQTEKNERILSNLLGLFVILIYIFIFIKLIFL